MNAALTVLAVVVAAGAVRALTQTLPPLRRPRARRALLGRRGARATASGWIAS